jgi:DtxR family Mn-dependent transcriptional regulator
MLGGLMADSKNISENIEEYLEVLYRNGSNGEQVSTTTLSKELGIAPGSVTQMLKKLEDLGYITYTPYKGAVLTDEGMKIAQKITRKHRILEKFLLDVLKIKEENVHDQACEMEHTLSDEAERALCTMLHHPDLCPDDNIIPACNFDFESCQECFSQKDFDQIMNRKFNLLSISELNSNAEGIISFIRGSSELLDEISALNIKIGSHLSYEYNENRVGNHYLVVIDDEELNIPFEMANNIFIRI